MVKICRFLNILTDVILLEILYRENIGHFDHYLPYLTWLAAPQPQPQPRVPGSHVPHHRLVFQSTVICNQRKPLVKLGLFLSEKSLF